MAAELTVEAARGGLVGRQRLVLAGLVLAVFVNNANFSATTLALPSIQKSFDLGFSGLQWTMTAYLVTYAAFMLVGGRLADVIGLRTVDAAAAGTAWALGGVAIVAAAGALLCLVFPRT
jgi:MFS family permease